MIFAVISIWSNFSLNCKFNKSEYFCYYIIPTILFYCIFSRHGISLNVSVLTPTTPSCLRLLSVGPCLCWKISCPGIWRSSTKSITSIWNLWPRNTTIIVKKPILHMEPDRELTKLTNLDQCRPM